MLYRDSKQKKKIKLPKKLAKKYFCFAGHIYMLVGRNIFFRGPAFHSKNLYARGPQFANPCFKLIFKPLEATANQEAETKYKPKLSYLSYFGIFNRFKLLDKAVRFAELYSLLCRRCKQKYTKSIKIDMFFHFYLIFFSFQQYS